jgi:hypothetical protein
MPTAALRVHRVHRVAASAVDGVLGRQVRHCGSRGLCSRLPEADASFLSSESACPMQPGKRSRPPAPNPSSPVISGAITPELVVSKMTTCGAREGGGGAEGDRYQRWDGPRV